MSDANDRSQEDEEPTGPARELPYLCVTMEQGEHGLAVTIDMGGPGACSPDLLDQVVRRVLTMHGLTELEQSLHDDDLDERSD